MTETDQFQASEPKSLRIATGRPRSNTWALRHLAKFFHRPYLKACTTDGDRADGNARLRVMCKHKQTGKLIGVVEVVGPRDALPKAALVGACSRIGVKVGFDAMGGVTFEKMPPPAAPTNPTPDANATPSTPKL